MRGWSLLGDDVKNVDKNYDAAYRENGFITFYSLFYFNDLSLLLSS